MSEIYPCRVIITSNQQLANYYNENPENALMASRCITVEQAFSLLEEEREIEMIILVNGEGEEVISYLGERLGWSESYMPDIVRVEVPNDTAVAEISIRDAMYKSSLLFVWAG